MAATLIGFLFFFAIVMALGTIAGMARAYHGKAIAALRMEHHPARIDAGTPKYRPARPSRFAAPNLPVEHSVLRRARAA